MKGVVRTSDDHDARFLVGAEGGQQMRHRFTTRREFVGKTAWIGVDAHANHRGIGRRWNLCGRLERGERQRQ